MILNWQLAKHPINWATIFLMLLIAGIGGSLALAAFGKTYDKATGANPAITQKPLAATDFEPESAVTSLSA